MNSSRSSWVLTAAAFLIVAVIGVLGCAAPEQAVEEAPAEMEEETTAAEPEAEAEMVELLFVQHSDSVTLEDGVLTLVGIDDDVLYFSDRPHRVVGRETVEEFVEVWDEGKESFEEIPPNAVLVSRQDDQLKNLTVVLRNPVLADGNLTYEVEVLDGPESGSGGLAALFIDVFGLEPGRPGRLELGGPGGPRQREFDRPGRGRSGRGGDHRRFRGSIKRDIQRG